MPIKNLTTNIEGSFPTLGVLRKGGPKPQTGNMPGADLTHFRFVGATPEAQRAFDEAYGGKPVMVEVYLPGATIDECWSAWQEEWLSGGLVHRCDSETMYRWQQQDGTYSDKPQPCPYAMGKKQRTAKAPGCKPVGRLKLTVPGLLERGQVGYVTFLTTSKNDIASLTASLEEAAKLREGDPYGLRGILWQLCREPVPISTPSADGKRVRRVKSLVRIRPSAKWVLRQLALAEKAALGDGATLQLTPFAGQAVDQATGEIMLPPGESDDEDDDIVDSTATEATEMAACDPPAFLDEECKRTAVASYLYTHRVPDSEIPPLVDAWRRRCLDREAVLAEAKRIIDALKRANGNGKATPTQNPAPVGGDGVGTEPPSSPPDSPGQATTPAPAPTMTTSPATAGGDSATPDSIPPSSKPAAAVDPTPPAREAPAEAPIDAEWADEIRGMFIDAGIPVAIRTPAMRQWADAGSTRAETVALFRKLVRDYKRDPDATLDVWNRQAGTTAPQPQPAPEPEGEPF